MPLDEVLAIPDSRQTALVYAASYLGAHAISKEENIMPNTLIGKTIAILATDGFEESELTKPKKALEEAGAHTQVVSPTEKDKRIKGWDHKDWGEEVAVDASLKSASADQYDALLLPGGVMNPDQLRMNPDAVNFVKSFFDQGK